MQTSSYHIGNRGFSIGIDDVQASEALLKERARVVEFRYRNCDELTERFKRGTLELVSGMNAEQSLEVINDLCVCFFFLQIETRHSF